jgi:hypothetical protein
MNLRTAILVILVVSGGAWWFLYEDDEARVRNSHEQLVRLVSKVEGDPDTPSVFDIQALRGLFAENCEVSGDADVFVGSYSSETMVARIVQVKGLFASIQLSFDELVIEFPSEDDAVANFSAVLIGRSMVDGVEDVRETRAVTSRMRRVEGDWLFSAFRLREVQED